MDTNQAYFNSIFIKSGYDVSEASWYDSVNALYNEEKTKCYQIVGHGFKAVVTVKEKEVCFMALYFYEDRYCLKKAVDTAKIYCIEKNVNMRFSSIMDDWTRKCFSQMSGFKQIKNSFDIIWTY